MAIKLTVDMDRCVVTGPMGNRLVMVMSKLQGRRGYINKNTQFAFHNAQFNIDLFMKTYPEAELEDLREEKKKAAFGQGLINFARPVRPPFVQARSDYAHQTRAHEKIDHLNVCALFMGTGTGKTKVCLDKYVKLWCEGEIDALMVLTLKGVHRQWATEQVPEHVHESIPRICHVWEGLKTVREKKRFNWFIKQKDKMQILCLNVDSVKGDKAWELIRRFTSVHQGRIAIALDESQEIATHDSARSVAIREMAEMIKHKMIMSGTPLPKDLQNEWAQFLFLDPGIIGHTYVTAFRKEYCDMGGFQNNKVISHRNLERFHQLTSPYIFRVTKEEELDLPAKVYTKEVFELSADQRKHYDNLKASFITKLDSGEVSTVPNAAVLVMRLQQITNGFLTDEDGTVHELPNPRLELMKKIDNRIPGKKIVWAHYNRDVALLKELFGSRCLTYVGSTSDKDREYAKKAFMDPDSGIDIFLSNPAAGGTGLNLQGECAHAIYYNNSFNAVDRWQSEDRIHRIGTYKTITYIDMVAMKTVDYRILANLKKKKDFQEFVLDDLRKIMSEDEGYDPRTEEFIRMLEGTE